MKNLIYSVIFLPFLCTPAISEIYATSVHEEVPGSHVQAPYDDAEQALGPPDERGDDPTPNWYSLGNGGTLTLKFDTPFMDGPGNDLTIYEVGRVGEICDVEIRAVGYEWTHVGRTKKHDSGIDISSFLASDSPLYFSYVKLTDVENDVQDTEKWAGADINAVGATHSVVKPVVKMESVGIEKSETPCLKWIEYNYHLQNYTNTDVGSLVLFRWLDGTSVGRRRFDGLLSANERRSMGDSVRIPLIRSGDYILTLDLYWIVNDKTIHRLDSASFELRVSECPQINGLLHSIILSVVTE